MAFPATIDVFTNQVDDSDYVLAADINGVQGDGDSNGGLEAVEAKLGVDSSAVATSIDYLLKSASSTDPGHTHSLLNNLAAAGNKLWSYANTAWTGWTIEAVTDSVLAVKGGTQAYNVTGGQTAGTWTQPDCTLDATQIPNHQHSINTRSDVSVPTGGSNEIASFDVYPTNDYTGITGAGLAHNHGTTYRPLAAIGIIISKDA